MTLLGGVAADGRDLARSVVELPCFNVLHEVSRNRIFFALFSLSISDSAVIVEDFCVLRAEFII